MKKKLFFSILLLVIGLAKGFPGELDIQAEIENQHDQTNIKVVITKGAKGPSTFYLYKGRITADGELLRQKEDIEQQTMVFKNLKPGEYHIGVKNKNESKFILVEIK